VEAIYRLVPCESVVFTDASLTEGTSRGLTYPPEKLAEWENTLPAWDELMLQNPNLIRMMEDPTGVHQWTDGDLDAMYESELYRRFFGVFGITHQMTFAVPCEPGTLRGFGLNRRDGAFSEDERAVCAELSPYLGLLFSSVARRDATLVAGLDAGGGWTAAVVNSAGEVVHAAGPGGFGFDDSGMLDAALREWIVTALAGQRNAANTDPIDGAVSSVGPERVQSADVRLIPDATGMHLIIVRPGVGAAPTMPSDLDERLTPRQREVVSELANGGTNDEIARRLGISIETVKKHLTASYRELGVADRTSAVAALRRS